MPAILLFPVLVIVGLHAGGVGAIVCPIVGLGFAAGGALRIHAAARPSPFDVVGKLTCGMSIEISKGNTLTATQLADLDKIVETALAWFLARPEAKGREAALRAYLAAGSMSIVVQDSPIMVMGGADDGLTVGNNCEARWGALSPSQVPVYGAKAGGTWDRCVALAGHEVGHVALNGLGVAVDDGALQHAWMSSAGYPLD